jgi:PAS domain-containing protein
VIPRSFVGRELADFFDSASLPLFWIARDDLIVPADQAVLDLLGYTREESTSAASSRAFTLTGMS